MDDNQKQDLRSLQRHALSEPVDVFDRLSQSLLGRLVNIHREGLMVMGSYPFDAERLYLLELKLAESINGRASIPLGVDCLWSRSEESQMHWAGFKIIDASEEALGDIDTLIFAFSNAEQ